MSKVLVAYFSASGVTKKAAEEIAKAEQAELFEILPEVPYTAKDLDWTNKQSRSTLEMQDPGCRPPVSGQVENIEIALKKTTSKTNPNFDYLNKILSDWHDRNLKTTDEIENYLKNSKIKNKNIKELEKNTSKLSYKNYEQRNYDNLNSLYTNNF